MLGMRREDNVDGYDTSWTVLTTEDANRKVDISVQ